MATNPVLGNLVLGMLVPWNMAKLNCRFRWTGLSAGLLVAGLVLFAAGGAKLDARQKEKISYGEGLIVNIPFPEADVEQVVHDVAQNGIIRGTKEYNKDLYVTGAKEADSTRVFPAWTEGGKAFYKVRLMALDPRNFKDSGDVGTLAVRYVVQPQGNKNTVLRINALFVEDFRHTVHASNGSVESSEYKDIRDRLESIAVMRQQTAEVEKERQQQLQKKRLPALNGDGDRAAMSSSSNNADDGTRRDIAASTQVATERPSSPAPAGPTPASQAQAVQNQPVQNDSSQSASSQLGSSQSLEQHVQDLRRQVERLVKAPGAPLKSAPFHTASTLSALTTGTEVLILISTPYWYGVETRDGQHGWVFRDEVEPMP